MGLKRSTRLLIAIHKNARDAKPGTHPELRKTYSKYLKGLKTKHGSKALRKNKIEVGKTLGTKPVPIRK